MPKASKIVRTIDVGKKYKFDLEIYLGLEDTFSWEIFPYDYKAALYAFSNKDKLNKLIEDKHVFEKKEQNADTTI
jgi:hypothetical protein